MEQKNILEEANNIIKRGEEKEREYGDFSKSMESAAKIATEISGKDITTRDMFICMIALKFGRLRYNDKRDTYVDAAAYLQGLHNFTIDNLTTHLDEIVLPNNHVSSIKNAINELNKFKFPSYDDIKKNITDALNDNEFKIGAIVTPVLPIFGVIAGENYKIIDIDNNMITFGDNAWFLKEGFAIAKNKLKK